MKTLIAFLALFSLSALAQQINPNQIQPCPVNGQVLVTSGGVTTCGYPAAPLSITGFSVSPSSAEIGQTVTNPTLTASYNETPGSAQITNTAGIDSPLSLVSPFTSGTVTGTFVENTQTNVTFTLSATLGNTVTQNSNLSWLPRYFYGVGTAGATGATASGTTAVLTGATGTLSSGGLGASQVGVTFPVISVSNQKIYLLMIGTGHTFIDNLTGFALPFNSPTAVSFTNQYGDVVSMELYESTNTLSGNYQPKVVN